MKYKGVFDIEFQPVFLLKFDFFFQIFFCVFLNRFDVLMPKLNFKK